MTDEEVLSAAREVADESFGIAALTVFSGLGLLTLVEGGVIQSISTSPVFIALTGILMSTGFVSFLAFLSLPLYIKLGSSK